MIARPRSQLAWVVLGMCLVAPLQYAWTLFAAPLSEVHGWTLSSVQLGFTVFICAQTFVQLPVGFLLDRYGPTGVCSFAALLVGLGWGGLGFVGSLPALYAAYGVAGLGAGAIYGVNMSVALRWYPHRRGLALGVANAGYGVGTAPFFPLVAGLIEGSGYQTALVVLGAVQGAGLLVTGLALRYPRQVGSALESEELPRRSRQREAGPRQLIRTPEFWLIYAVFMAIGTGGLTMIANFKAFADANAIGPALVVTSLVLQQAANGLGRVAWGWVSDRHGRCRTMVVAFAINSAALFMLPVLGGSAAAAFLVAPVVLFTWGEAYSLLPALVGDRYGSAHTAGNQGLLYSAKGVASLVGGALIAWVAAAAGWTAAFWTVSALALFAASGAYALGRLTSSPRDGRLEPGADAVREEGVRARVE